MLLELLLLLELPFEFELLVLEMEEQKTNAEKVQRAKRMRPEGVRKGI